MKKIIVAGLMVLAACFAHAQQLDKYVINGKFSGVTGGQIVMLMMEGDGAINVVDSTRLNQGKFSFTGTVDGFARAFLVMKAIHPDTSKTKKRTADDLQEFYLEKGNVAVNGTDKMKTAVIKAGHAQEEYVLYESQTHALVSQMVSLMNQVEKTTKDKNDSAAHKAAIAEARKTLAVLSAVKDSFIYQHPDSYISLGLVKAKTTMIDLATFEPFYNTLSKRVLSSKTGRELTNRLQIAKNTTPGNPMDFTQDDADGKPFTLASLKGKYVLVDFWASWCHPCRAENPNVRKAYARLKDKNFEIVGVSLDNYKPAWIEAVKKDSLPWIQVCDLKGWKNDLAIKYGISAVPQNFLVDPNGIIIARNLRGEDLYDKLSAIMPPSKN